MVGMPWLILPACIVVAFFFIFFISCRPESTEGEKKITEPGRIDRRYLVMTYDPPATGLCRSVPQAQYQQYTQVAVESVFVLAPLSRAPPSHKFWYPHLAPLACARPLTTTSLPLRPHLVRLPPLVCVSPHGRTTV